MAPSIIGYFASETGDFRWGIGFFGCLAIVAASILFFVGRTMGVARSAAISGRASAGH